MLPVVRGDRATARQILYARPRRSHARAVRSPDVRAVYLGAAPVLGGTFVYLAWRVLRETTPPRARLLFHYSLAYLALLFAAMAADPLLS